MMTKNMGATGVKKLRNFVCFFANLSLCMLAAVSVAHAEEGWFDTALNNVSKTWYEGKPDIYVPIYSWHLPFAYTRQKIKTYQVHPIGFGYGYSRLDEKNNEHAIFAMGFQDSHFKPEWVAGYSWKTFYALNNSGNLKLGLGFMAGVSTRADYSHYLPFPLILPMASIDYKALSISATYVPGGKGNGNVVFFSSRWHWN